jgi:hypothetical protein
METTNNPPNGSVSYEAYNKLQDLYIELLEKHKELTGEAPLQLTKSKRKNIITASSKADWTATLCIEGEEKKFDLTPLLKIIEGDSFEFFENTLRDIHENYAVFYITELEHVLNTKPETHDWFRGTLKHFQSELSLIKMLADAFGEVKEARSEQLEKPKSNNP